MKVREVDKGVYRIEPEPDELPAWNLSRNQLIDQGWSEDLVAVIEQFLRVNRPDPDAE